MSQIISHHKQQHIVVSLGHKVDLLDISNGYTLYIEPKCMLPVPNYLCQVCVTAGVC